MNRDVIFTRLGFEKEFDIDKTYYKGPDGAYYDLDVTDKRIFILKAPDKREHFDQLMRLMRIYPMEDMQEILYVCLKGYLDDPEAHMETYYDTFYQEQFIRGTLGRKLGPREIENLCILFYETVRIGDSTLSVTDTVKEVLKIHAMPPSEFVSPELHELLLKVPDTYFDFIQGIERNTQRKTGLQNRYIQYMKNHPQASSIDLIIYGSMLNADMTYKDEWIQRVIDNVNSDRTFSIYNVNHGTSELIQADNKHDWHIFMKYVKGTGFTFRQAKSLVFVDYMDSCIRAAMLCNVGEEIAMFYDIAEKKPDFDGVYEALIEYTEKLAREAGMNSMVAFVRPEYIGLYESLGFALSEDEIIDNPYEFQCERSYMEKKL